MGEMNIPEQLQYKELDDYDFSLVSGARLPLTLDTKAGDTITENDTHYTLVLCEKPNFLDPEIILPSEHITVAKSAVAVLIHRKRQQLQPTEEQKFNMRKTLHQLAEGIQ